MLILKNVAVGLNLLCAGLFLAQNSLAKDLVYKPKISSYEKLPAAKKGGTLYLDLYSNPKVMNPILSADTASSALEGYLWTSLFSEDADSLDPLPYLAQSYSVSSDHKTYTFTLNPKAKWEDGSAVTTADVEFTFKTMMNPKIDAASLRVYWEGVELKILDNQKFQFIVKEPKFDTLRSLYLFVTIQKKQFEAEPNFNTAKGILSPIGDGPYKLKKFSRDQRVELTRNKEWWGYDLPHFKHRFNADEIVLRIISDDTLGYEKFIKGELDLLSPNAETFATKVRGKDKDRFDNKPGGSKPIWAGEFKNKAPRGYTYLGWNLKKPLFQSVKVRTALSHLVDYAKVMDQVYHGLYYPATSPFGSLTLNSDAELRKPGKMIQLDPKKALVLLKEEGWADSNKDNLLDKVIDGKRVDFKFTLKYNSNNPLRAKISQIVKENFKKAGIEVEIRSMEWNAFLEDVDNRNFDALILAWTATPYPNPKQTWHTDSEKNKGSNFISYSNPKVDALIEKANVEMDPKKRFKLLQEINRLVYADQPYTFLAEPASLLATFSKRLKSPVWAQTYDVGAPVDLYSIGD